MNSQEKREILKSVEAALSEDGAMLLAYQSPSQEGITVVTRGIDDATVAAALANLGLYAEDER